MLCGQPPFRQGPDGSAISVIMSHVNVPPPPPVNLNPSLSPAVSNALLRALAKRPQDRFRTCTEFVSALKGYGVPATPGQYSGAGAAGQGPGTGALGGYPGAGTGAPGGYPGPGTGGYGGAPHPGYANAPEQPAPLGYPRTPTQVAAPGYPQTQVQAQTPGYPRATEQPYPPAPVQPQSPAYPLTPGPRSYTPRAQRDSKVALVAICLALLLLVILVIVGLNAQKPADTGRLIVKQRRRLQDLGPIATQN